MGQYVEFEAGEFKDERCLCRIMRSVDLPPADGRSVLICRCRSASNRVAQALKRTSGLAWLIIDTRDKLAIRRDPGYVLGVCLVTEDASPLKLQTEAPISHYVAKGAINLVPLWRVAAALVKGILRPTTGSRGPR